MKPVDPTKVVVLGLDTVGAEGGVALLIPSGPALARELGERGRHAEALVPEALALMAEAGIGWGDLDLIAVNVGPGSFTGIRIGLAAALGIHSATGTPAAGVGCLDIAARACYDATSPAVGSYIVCAADVRRSEVVLAGFRIASDGPVRLDGDRLTATDRAGDAPEGATLAGDGAALLWPEAPLARWVPTGAQRAVAAARLGLAAWARGEAEPPAPRYARGADARPRVR